MARSAAIVVFGDVVESRELPRATDWLRALRADLESAYGSRRLAPFEFTQGDELQGLLRADADPFDAVVRAATHELSLEMRWVIVAGDVEAGRGPATQRTGPAYLAARELAIRSRRRRDRLVVLTRDPDVDLLLAGLTPALGRLLADLTRVQRAVARLVLVEGLRQVEVARRLRIKPPTVSVAADRANLREIAGLLETARRLFADGGAGAQEPG